MRTKHIFYEKFAGYKCHSRLFDLSGSHKGGVGVLYTVSKGKHSAKIGSRDLLVGIGTKLRAGWSGIPVPVGVEHCSSHQNLKTVCGANSASHSFGTEFFPGSMPCWG
jgi:hypothetical protein